MIKKSPMTDEDTELLIQQEKSRLQAESKMLDQVRNQMDLLVQKKLLHYYKLMSPLSQSERLDAEKAWLDIMDKESCLHRQENRIIQGMDYRLEFLVSYENEMTLREFERRIQEGKPNSNDVGACLSNS